jgi:Zn finger protein HypA/HybF involved in hydrogenase expression
MDACQECHTDIYDVFVMSGHPYKLNKVVDGEPPSYPFTELPSPPEGYTWDDVSYVIGGYNWKARFIDQEEYIITGDADATTQYNFYNEILGMGDNWVGYHAGEENKPYDCGPCHTTGYSPEGNQDGLPGMVGTWSEGGIRCEECHGPGSLHVENPQFEPMEIDRDSQQCGGCHVRGGFEAVNASGGFIKHHEQYEELFSSKKRVMDCVDCHDPHLGVIAAREQGLPTTHTPCEACHLEQAEFQASEVHPAAAECIDCHMPRISKSALGNADIYSGDIRSHMMRIWPFATEQFNEEGDTAMPYVTLDFACKSCHSEGGMATVKTDEELIEKAVGYHDRP